MAVPGAAMAAALSGAPDMIGRDILRATAAGRRTALAEKLIGQVHREHGDEDASVLLPACGHEVAAAWLPRLFRAAATRTAIGRAHPDLVLAEAARQMASLPPADVGRWWFRYAGLVAAARIMPIRYPIGPHARYLTDLYYWHASRPGRYGLRHEHLTTVLRSPPTACHEEFPCALLAGSDRTFAKPPRGSPVGEAMPMAARRPGGRARRRYRACPG